MRRRHDGEPEKVRVVVSPARERRAWLEQAEAQGKTVESRPMPEAEQTASTIPTEAWLLRWADEIKDGDALWLPHLGDYVVILRVREVDGHRAFIYDHAGEQGSVLFPEYVACRLRV